MTDWLADGWALRDFRVAPRGYFSVRTSTIQGAGRGLFAKRALPANTVLGWYFGRPCLVPPEHSGNVMEVRQKPPWMNDQTYAKFARRSRVYIDSSGPYKCFLQKVNHCPGKGANLIVLSDGEYITRRRIRKNEELFINYGATYWKNA
jgi:hypothetical protein